VEIKSLKTWIGFGLTCVGNAAMNIFPDLNWLGWPILVVGLGMLTLALSGCPKSNSF
jgi:hypothetical protein